MLGCSDCCSSFSSCCDSCGCAEITVLTTTVTALVVGTIGLLVLTGYLLIGWAGIGCITQTTSLYLMLTGYIITFIASILIGITYYRGNATSTLDPLL